MSLKTVALAGAALGLVAYSGFASIPRVDIPSHLTNHHAIFKEGLLSHDERARMRSYVDSLGELHSNIAADLKNKKFITAASGNRNEEVGEAMPLLLDGSCEHPFLTKSVSGTRCVLPQRVDIGMAFVQTGGFDGLRESYDSLISRTTSFGSFNNLDKLRASSSSSNHTKTEMLNEEVMQLFQKDQFQSVAREVCPSEKQVLDPFQYNFIVNLPGQTVPVHLDAPWFYGADRRTFPQWLLVAMTFSGLFQDRFIDQVQVVAYLHSWHPDDDHEDVVSSSESIHPVTNGEFVHFPDNHVDPVMVRPIPGAGSAVDGSKYVHAARTYRPQDKLPILPKDKESKIVYIAPEEDADDATWQLRVDDELVRTYTGSDLRVSMVYRARCFESIEARNDYHNQDTPTRFGDLSIDQIFAAFRKDLLARGYTPPDPTNQENTLDLAMMILRVYIKYPLPSVERRIMPYNYCAVPRLFPSLAPLVKFLC